MKSSLAVVIEFGFHDIKKYIHSGLTAELSKEFEIVWIVVDKENPVLNQYLTETGFPIIYISESNIISIQSKRENYNQSIRRSWMVNKDVGLFHNYQVVRHKSLKTKLIGNPLFKFIFEQWTLKVYKQYYNVYISDILAQQKVDKILFAGYGSSFIKNIVASAERLGIGTYCIVNSWKDLYVNNFIPFTNLQKLFVWDDQMKIDYLYHMSYLKSEQIVVSGNPTFDYLIDSKPQKDRAYYAQKYNIPADSSWIYYTMMPPVVVDDEIKTIVFIAKEFKKYFGEQYIFLVRRNPNHSPTEFSSLDLPSNVQLTEHFCHYDGAKDMLVQTQEGEQEWLDLLHHTVMNLSVPSTVTMEYLILGKPIFNIAFDKNNLLDNRLDQFFKAGFYRHLFGHGLVHYIESIDRLIKSLDAIDRPFNKSKEEVDKSVPKICEVLKYD